MISDISHMRGGRGGAAYGEEPNVRRKARLSLSPYGACCTACRGGIPGGERPDDGREEVNRIE